MITAWRICKARHAATAFDGYGAKLYGGRWNSPSNAVVYTASVSSQALLEMLVHADSSILSLSYVLIPIIFHKKLVEQLDLKTLPRNWRQNQVATRKLGDRWIHRQDSAVLSVPSAIVGGDPNFLINPSHPDLSKIDIGKPQRLAIDNRIKALFE